MSFGPEYFDSLRRAFERNSRLGIASGLCCEPLRVRVRAGLRDCDAAGERPTPCRSEPVVGVRGLSVVLLTEDLKKRQLVATGQSPLPLEQLDVVLRVHTSLRRETDRKCLPGDAVEEGR